MHCIIVAKAREYPISFQPSYSISNKALLGYRRYKSKLKARVSTAKYIVCTRAIALLFAALQRNTTLYSFFFLGYAQILLGSLIFQHIIKDPNKATSSFMLSLNLFQNHNCSILGLYSLEV